VSVARERGVHAFTAQTLPQNRRMLGVFADAGLPVHREMTGGVVELTFPIPAVADDRSLDGYLDSVAVRESRADVASCGTCYSRQRWRWWAPAGGGEPWAGDPAQHRDRGLHRNGLSGQPAGCLAGGPALPGLRG